MPKTSQTYSDVPESLVREAVQDLDIFDDTFARHFFKNEDVVAEVLKNITGKEELVIDEVKIQKTIDNFTNHSIILDVFARDDKKNIYGIELQKRSAGANKKRVRYYAGLMESEALKKREPYPNLPEKWTIFITEKDLFGAGYPFYHVDKVIRELGIPYNDGSHIVYVNGSFKDRSTSAGDFIADLTSIHPEEIKNPIIKQRMIDLKQTEEGEKIMSTALTKHLGSYIDQKAEQMAEQMAEQRVQEARKRGIEKGRNEEKINNIVDTFKAGLSLNGLVQAFHLPADEIRDILQQHNLSV